MTAAVEVRVPPVCPGCGVKSPAGKHPSTLEVNEGGQPLTWWCPACIAAMVRAAHDENCRCEQHAPRSAS